MYSAVRAVHAHRWSRFPYPAVFHAQEVAARWIRPCVHPHLSRSVDFRFSMSSGEVANAVVTAELGYLSVGINTSVFSTFLLAVFSQYYLRRYRPRWFRKYNFLMSAALDGGTQVISFILNFVSLVPFPHYDTD